MAEGVSTSSLQAGFIELASIVRALHGDWSAPATGYEGWTCKDLLAHLTSSEASLVRIVESANQPPPADAPAFDADRWNAAMVRRRADRDAQDLLNEFDLGTNQVVEALTDADVHKQVHAGAFPGETIAAAMAQMLDHQRKHLDDLRSCLHKHPEL